MNGGKCCESVIKRRISCNMIRDRKKVIFEGKKKSFSVIKNCKISDGKCTKVIFQLILVGFT